MRLATLCYIRKNDKTLMLYRNKKKNDTHRGKWNGLGGKLEAGETPEACAIREVKEECGLNVLSLQLKGFLTFPLFDGEHDWYVFVFIINEFTGELITSSEGELEWIENDKLLELNLWAGDRIFLPWLEKGNLFSGIFKYEAGELLKWDVNFY